MLPVVSIVGNSNSGKTTLLEKVIARLKLRGFRVGVVKHAHHGFDIDRQGKDSWRFTQAGGDIVALSSPQGVVLFERADREPDLSQVIACFEGKTDVVLVEGYKGSDTAKIVVWRAGDDPEPVCLNGGILARVSASPCSSGVPRFDDDTVTAVVNLVAEQIARAGPLHRPRQVRATTSAR